MIKCNDVQEQAADLAPILFDRWRDLLASGDFILGTEVARFERWMSQRCAGAYAVSLNSGTDALVVALRAFGIGSGDEVITCANSFVATVGAVVAVGACPVFADVGEDELLSVATISELVSSKTRAVIPVYLRGRPLDISGIVDFCHARGLVVIEDCAQAIGTEVSGVQVGTVSDASAFSFHPLKTLGCLGDGGALVTTNSAVAEYARQVRNHGLRSREESAVFGVNSRLDSIQAVVLNVKADYLDGWLQRRKEIACFYQDRLVGTELGGELGGNRAGSSFCHYVLATTKRDQLFRYLEERGIQAAIHYPVPIHKQKAWLSHMNPVHLPTTERLAKEILTIPCHNHLSDGAVEKIAKALTEFSRRG